MIRKKTGLTPTDKVVLYYFTNEKEFASIIEKSSEQIIVETKLKAIENKKTDNMTDVKIEGKSLNLDIKK
jgi:hypothetical protein